MPLNQDSQDIHLFNVQPAKTLNMSHGWLWINEGFRYFTFAKITWISILITLVISVLLLINFLPIMQLFIIVILPMVTAGLALACYAIECGKPINVSYLVKGFTHPHNVKLIKYGLWLILLMIIAQMIASMVLITMGVTQENITLELQKLSKSTNPTMDVILASPTLIRYFTVNLITVLPITAINLFAPYLLIFSTLSALESIKYSALAMLKNIPVLIVYVAIYLLMIAAMVMILKGFNAILFGGFSKDSLVASWIDMVVTMMGVFFLAALSYCSAYVAFKDVFLGEEI